MKRTLTQIDYKYKESFLLFDLLRVGYIRYGYVCGAAVAKGQSTSLKKLIKYFQ